MQQMYHQGQVGDYYENFPYDQPLSRVATQHEEESSSSEVSSDLKNRGSGALTDENISKERAHNSDDKKCT